MVDFVLNLFNGRLEVFLHVLLVYDDRYIFATLISIPVITDTIMLYH